MKQPNQTNRKSNPGSKKQINKYLPSCLADDQSIDYSHKQKKNGTRVEVVSKRLTCFPHIYKILSAQGGTINNRSTKCSTKNH